MTQLKNNWRSLIVFKSSAHFLILFSNFIFIFLVINSNNSLVDRDRYLRDGWVVFIVMSGIIVEIRCWRWISDSSSGSITCYS